MMVSNAFSSSIWRESFLLWTAKFRSREANGKRNRKLNGRQLLLIETVSWSKVDYCAVGWRAKEPVARRSLQCSPLTCQIIRLKPFHWNHNRISISNKNQKVWKNLKKEKILVKLYRSCELNTLVNPSEPKWTLFFESKTSTFFPEVLSLFKFNCLVKRSKLIWSFQFSDA